MVFTLNLSFVLSSKYTLVIAIVHIKMNTKYIDDTNKIIVDSSSWNHSRTPLALP